MRLTLTDGTSPWLQHHANDAAHNVAKASDGGYLTWSILAEAAHRAVLAEENPQKLLKLLEEQQDTLRQWVTDLEARIASSGSPSSGEGGRG